jgi:hypothetical protein
MKKHLLVLRSFCVIAFASLASCVPNYGSVSLAALQQRGLKQGEGFIVGKYQNYDYDSKGQEARSLVNSSMVRARQLGSNTRVTINNNTAPSALRALFPGANYSQDGCFAIPVPAGNYAIDSWMISANAGYGTIVVSNRLPLRVPFQVEAGKATYVGKTNVISLYGRSLIGLPAYDRGIIIITDSYEKDAKEIASVYPSIARSQIKPSKVPELYANEMKRIANTPGSNWWQKLF